MRVPEIASSGHNVLTVCRLAFPALLLAVLVSGCGQDSTATASPDKSSGPKAREVRVVPVTEARLARTVAVTGALAADDQIVLSLKVTGRLSELTIDLGSPVRAGQVVARLDPADFKLRLEQADAALQQARVRLGLSPRGTDDRVEVEQTALVRQARAVLDEARLNRERMTRLAEQEFVARAQLDSAVAAEQVADGRYQDALEEVRNRQAILAQRRSELELARQSLTDTVLTAPVDGMIRERRASVGEYLAAGTPVATLVRMHPLRLILAVPERAAAGIRVGQEVRVGVEGDPATYRGRVARLSPTIQEQSRTLTVEAEVPNQQGRLRPGAFAKAEIVVAADQTAVFVPVSAIVVFAGIEKVLMVRDGRSVEVRVQTGRREGDRVEIVSGLTAGQQVVADPGNLVGGQPVEVRD
ncbi:MAG TPA: efflux RND transporter periplasmic adaptor subunit [Methylomirabilota bacterium]